MKKFSFKPILFMMLLSVLFTGTLATINEMTGERIQMNAALKEQRSLLYVLNMPIQTKDPVEVSNFYRNHIQPTTIEGVRVYEGYVNGQLIGYALPVEGDAVWGRLKGFIGLSPDFSQIIGVDFLSHSETPGLGGRIDELAFKDQFRNISIDVKGDGEYIIYRPNPNGQVDSISGATGTSNAVRRILNQNLKNFFTEVRGGN